jgi:hypothetical protein
MSNIHTSALYHQEEHSTHFTLQSDDHTQAFLSEFAPLHETHHLLPTDLDLNPFLSMDEVFSALANGSIELTLDSNDEPSWTQALTSSE